MPLERINLMLPRDLLNFLDHQAERLNAAGTKPPASRSMMVRIIAGGLADAGATFSGPPDEQRLRRAVAEAVAEALNLRKGSTSTHRR